MPRQTAVTVTVATLLGIAVGGLVLWKVSRRRKEKVCGGGNQVGALRRSGDEELTEVEEKELHSCVSSPTISWVEQILGAEIVIVSQAEEWDRVEPLLKKELQRWPVLGIDCEWVSVEGKASPVSLLQMASSSGFCILVRLPRKDLLCNGLSLKSLAENVLNCPLDKSLRLRCSNWEAEELTQDQVTYAAKDAQVSMALFLHLLGFFFIPAASGGENVVVAWAKVLGKCQGLMDVPFRGRSSSSLGDDGNGEVDSQQKPRNRKSATNGQSPVNQQVKDPRKQKRKPLGVGYSARKSPLYDNCFLHAPDGQPLCTCDRKKAQWYLDKGIGELVSTDPFVVKLQFEPSGRPESQVDYYLTVKENLCVVCGKRESYIRKNIVPHEYRRHFPIQMKDHNSHDVLLLCTSCHAISNYYDNHLKQRLAEEFGAPIGCEEGVRLLEDPLRRQVRSGARALLNADSLPDTRREELLQGIKDFFNTETITSEMLQEAAGLETRICNESYMPHGLKVVQCFAKGGLRSLMELERRWRQHFLDTMQPKHLPKRWSVNHNHGKLIRKYGEDLPIELS
nr:exonuclease 3'-5' domain-containing protein 2 isoform X4 [Chrysemys picta bellii]